jgi:3-oxoacyl-(acyl-carrier-protein) synthase/3-hydroxymyristoyl/3-hydroxydecanoyl-(acyl carrier protein) dehydratase/1-acyl-sn-glycerol-3-phosphate acyltransferase
MFDPIAIVGRACVLPGALTPDELWCNLAAGRDLLAPPPAGHWGLDPAQVAVPRATGPETACSQMGGYVAGFEKVFDAEGFDVSADRILPLDPLFKWLLYCGRQALAEAGAVSNLSRVGTILGNLSYPTRGHAEFAQSVWLSSPEGAAEHMHGDAANRFSSGYPAHVLAKALGLGGEALMLDAACASSLYAIKFACDRLHDGEADLMLAGAVNRADDLFLHIGFTSLHALSPSGRSRPFDRAADGLLPAEGAAIVALKRLDDAVRDGNRIFGAIRGVGLSNDGRQRGFLAPDSRGQVRAMQAAYAQSGLSPADIGYVECHATGTPVGDSIEIASMAEVFGDGPSVPVGSLKSNLGHLITASGAAGLLKVLAMMEHDTFSPTLNVANPIKALEDARFRPQSEIAPWTSGVPRFAAVNSFGFGGNNAHLLVEAFEPEAQPKRRRASSASPGNATPVAVCGLGIVAGNCRGLGAFVRAVAEPEGTKARTAIDTVELPLKGLRFPPKDLAASLPQQGLIIEAAMEAKAQVANLPVERTAVMIGMGCDSEVARYGLRWRLAELLAAGGTEIAPDWIEKARDAVVPPLTAAGVVGTMPNIPANRLNVQFDCTAMGFTVSSEELSGLSALKLAGRALAAGEIDAALVGAVDLSVEPVHMAAAETLFPSDRKRLGDGAVVMVLKRLEDAERDGDRIFAVISSDAATDDDRYQELRLDAEAGESAVTRRFGHAHAASGLLHAAWAMVAPGDGAAPVRRRVAVTSFSGRFLSLDLEARPGVAADVGVAVSDETDLISLPAHWPPIRVVPPQPVAEASIAATDAGEMKSAAVGQIMEPAPDLPPVSGLAPVTLPEPAVHAAAASLPGSSSKAVRAEAAAQVLEQAAEVHRSHLERQAQLYHEYLALQDAAWKRFWGKDGLAGAGIPVELPEPPPPPDPCLPAAPEVMPPVHEGPKPEAPPEKPEAAPVMPSGPTFNRRDLEHLSSGHIADLFGPLFERQAGYLRQVRMPQPPLLLADRVTGIVGELGSMTEGTMWTETDVASNAWYLHQGRMPPGIVIESGQADLLLISWLGADFLNKGERVYRLLGCELTFHDGGMPRPGDTLKFDIHVDGHAKTGDVRLFFFHYDCRIGGRTLLTVRDGQAGFFTDAELDSSGGILWRAEDDKPKADARLDPPPMLTEKREFSREEVAAFVDGDAFACFGQGFEMAATHQRTPSIPGGTMHLIDSVPKFDPAGGPWGRGYLRAVAHVPIDAWFYEGHFLNDPCMPGTLMADAAVQALAFSMAAMGFTIGRDGWRFEPATGEPFKFFCRGQVVPDRPHDLTYEIFIEEVIDGDEPHIFGALLCSSDGFKVFQCRRFGLKLVPDWPLSTRLDLIPTGTVARTVGTEGDVRGDYAALLACAWGAPTDAFGEMYARFDGARRVPRLPGPPYHFVSRIEEVDCPAGGATEGGGVTAEYDVLPDAWYFRANGQPVMPYSVLLEVALQPCGWLASYMGFTLSDNDLAFRNLDGDGAVVHALVGPQAGTLRTRAVLTRYSRVGDMTILFFRVTCDGDKGPVFEMNTSFGFFSASALANQVGLSVRDADRERVARTSDMEIDLRDEPPDYFVTQPRLAGGRLRMVDAVTGFWPDEGAAGLGRIRGRQVIDPEAWYFKAHFYQDPVQPGSLGIEALIQLLQAYVRLSGRGATVGHPRFEPIALGEAVVWKYRGQVLPTNREVVTELEVTAVEDGPDEAVVTAKGSLWVDGLRIYEVENLAVRVVSAEPALRFEDFPIDDRHTPWIVDHRPTHTVAVVPMMAEVWYALQAARSARPNMTLATIEDFRLAHWFIVPEDEGACLRVHMEDVSGHNDAVDVRLSAGGGGSGIARGRIRFVTGHEGPPEPWAEPVRLPAAEDQYVNGALFHGPAFQVAHGLRRDERGAVFEIAADRLAGAGVVALLDGALHGIPHDCPETWFGEGASGFIAFPRRLVRMTFFGDLPGAETFRIYARPAASDVKTVRVEVQIVANGTVWCEMEVEEILLPKGPLGHVPGVQRRAFLRDWTFVPEARLSEICEGETRLDEEVVRASNWLPGTLERIYGTAGDIVRMTSDIAIKEHVAQHARVHPESMTIDGDTAVCAALPGTRFRVRVDTHDRGIVVGDAAAPVFDLAPFRDDWRRRLGMQDWPVEDIYFSLVRRFVRSVRVEDPSALAALRGRPVLFLANHQVGIESLNFGVVGAAILNRPIVTIAKGEHRETWLGRLIAHCRDYPGARLPRALMFFDRDDQASMLAMMQDLQSALIEEGLSLMVHAEGTRSLQCGLPVSRVSGVFLDLAVKAGLPIVPVRFAGGLPREPMNERLEFPLGYGAQDIYLGQPLDAGELADLPLRPRREKVLDALNKLGPALSTEVPNNPDPAFQKAVGALVRDRGLPPARAAVLQALREYPDTGAPLTQVIDQLMKEGGGFGDGPDREWLSRLAAWFRAEA